ncbi:MAG: hypothetical protein L6R19_10530 [Alphaproteobacteria bacterium]|nr:hypothetical protein [Alphaproteobacteria bacterium]
MNTGRQIRWKVRDRLAPSMAGGRRGRTPPAAALIFVLTLPLAGCLGMGGGGAPPSVTVDGSAQAAARIGAEPEKPAADAKGVAMLDVFRRNPVGRELGQVDDVYAERSAQLALEYDKDGVPRGWTNPETGTTGAVKPVRTFKQAETWCREFAQTLQVRERGSKDVKGAADATGQVACRQPDGKWKFLP